MSTKITEVVEEFDTSYVEESYQSELKLVIDTSSSSTHFLNQEKTAEPTLISGQLTVSF